jgi:hypothetical protein
MLSWLTLTGTAEEERRRTVAEVGSRCSPAAAAGILLAGCGSLDLGSKTSQKSLLQEVRKACLYC